VYYLVGVDLGGTKIATALTDTDCQILKYDAVRTEAVRGPEAIIDQMVSEIRRVIEDLPKESVLGIGVACAGLIEPSTGKVLYSPNLDWRDLPLADMIARRLDYPIYVGNDVNMAALGELHYGAGIGKRQIVCVFVGTGIGGGIVIDGHLYEGANGFAGEIGHVTIDWDGPDCPSGNAGCWEGFASGTAMQRRTLAALDRGEPSMLAEMLHGDPSKMRVELIAEAAAKGDALARRIIAETGELLGAGCANLVNILNPERIILGGGVIRGVPELVDMVDAVVRRRALSDAVAGLDVVRARFGREAGVIGAAVLAKLAGKP
jgi:glucokinase